MAKEKETLSDCGCNKNWNRNAGAGGGAVYGFGLFGALYYYLSTAQSFGAVLFGILKAFVWPGILVYHALKLLKL